MENINIEIGRQSAKGKILSEHIYYDAYQFETEQQGICLFVDGKNILLDYQDSKVIKCTYRKKWFIKFKTEKSGYHLFKDNKNILLDYQKGDVSYCSCFENGDIIFKTQSQGFCLIRGNKNILLDYQDGEVTELIRFNDGNFRFRTEKQYYRIVIDDTDIFAALYGNDIQIPDARYDMISCIFLFNSKWHEYKVNKIFKMIENKTVCNLFKNGLK